MLGKGGCSDSEGDVSCLEVSFSFPFFSFLGGESG